MKKFIIIALIAAAVIVVMLRLVYKEKFD